MSDRSIQPETDQGRLIYAITHEFSKADGVLVTMLSALVEALCLKPGIDADKLRTDIRRNLAPPGRSIWTESPLLAQFAEHLQPLIAVRSLMRAKPHAFYSSARGY